MIVKAEYLFRPLQLIRRLTRRGPRRETSELIEVRLPWGRSIAVSPRDNIGPAVLALGVYDLVVTETLWRMTDPDDLALDIGANIGCMTAALGERAAEVLCFEPHPQIHAELAENVRRLSQQGIRARIAPHCLALGAQPGTLSLHIPSDFDHHRGESSLVAAEQTAQTVQVRVETIDSFVGEDRRVGVAKIDVEGFELQVLLGASQMLAQRRLRDCVFEEHRDYPSDVTTLLESHGYTVFRLARGLLRPRLIAPDSPEPRSAWEATSFLATCDPRRARRRMSEFGWRCLRRC